MTDINKTQETGKYHFNMKWMMFLPLFFVLGVVPLIVRMSVQFLDEHMAAAFKSPQVFDFFSQYKASSILLTTAIILFMTFLIFQKSHVKWDKQIMLYTIGAGLFALFTVLSTVFSEYSHTAMWGAPDRAEGMLILLSYLVLMYYTIYVVRSERDMKFIIIPLAILVAVLTVLGIFEFMGQNLLLTDEGKSFIIPKAYHQFKDALGVTYESGKVYGTLFHYNYMGSFGAMMFPLFGTLMFIDKDLKRKIFYALFSVMSLFLLLGSTSRAGIIGLVGSMLLFVVIFAKYLIKKWKMTLPLVASLIALLFIFNSATDGVIFERLPSLVSDAIKLVQGGDESFDYKDHIPVRGIGNEDGKVYIETQEGKLYIRSEAGEVAFADEKGAVVEYVLNGDTYTTTDPRFSMLSFKETVTTDENKVDGLFVVIRNINGFLMQYDADSIQLIHTYTGEPLEFIEAPAIGFKGKEKLGSARGYIWSRSLPMLKETILLGHGPDTYMFKFPQNDVLAKWYAYDTPNMTIDKPHNLYLQIALNEGLFALVGFLILIGVYLVDSIRLYAFKGFYSTLEGFGIALLLAITGYLGAGLFNDSIVSVAPIFWVLLGCGIALNYFVHEKKRQEKQIQKVVKLKK